MPENFFGFIMAESTPAIIHTGSHHHGMIHAAIIISRIHQTITPNII
jgi:hypothetical protein